MVDAHQTLKNQYIQLQEERDNVEHQYQHLCDGWRIELEGKQAAFDEARNQIVSQRCASDTAWLQCESSVHTSCAPGRHRTKLKSQLHHWLRLLSSECCKVQRLTCASGGLGRCFREMFGGGGVITHMRCFWGWLHVCCINCKGLAVCSEHRTFWPSNRHTCQACHPT